MKRKISITFVTVFACMVVISHVFAITYVPNRNDNIIKDNIATLDEVYTQEDVDKVLQIYNANREVTKEEINKYDLNDDNIVNSLDAALILDYMNNN